jgi:carboxypeptidase Q
MKKLLGAVSLLSLLLVAQSADDVNARIRREAADHSQILRTLHMLTDRYGPRLTGSPNHEAAAKWAVQQMTEWGFKNAHLEPWDFGHPGWLNESASGHIVSPVRANLKFEVLGWTPSTNGPVTGSAIELAPPQGPLPTRPAPAAPTAATADGESGGRGRGGAPQRLGPTKEEMQQWLEANKDKVRGKIVMMGKAASIAVDFTPPAKRRSDVQTRQQFDPNNPNAGRGGGRGGNQNPGDPNRLTANQVTETTDAWLKANGALMRINDAAMQHGLVRAFQNRTYDPSKVLPTVILRNEDYGRIERLLADGEDVRLKFDIVNRDYPAGKTSFNVVAEIPGSDKADEIVMLGGHLDSWHAATGATDNAIGSSIMMEAARIIQALGLKPRRTVRVALWSGEEQGLLGSQAYVKEHFGSAEEPKPEFAKLNCYFNIDSGTGRVRGASVFGPPTAAAIVRNALEPFADLGVVGAVATSSRAIGGTDSTSFNNAGLAGVGMTQDPIEYQSHTWHTMLDTYERIVPEDAKNAAIVIASAVWQVANRDEMLPRFTREQMPAKPRPSNR